ncbi:tam domain [Moniliophthora roreri MCA 2997]|uniref:Tam domain n=1 Tax=Moniliophthora roreri (strain MCA 2997) TaxID=1381753 RepID=V2YL35_MONRO|nr:tam domain [Moniliophthora roreri MCA 2997]
MTDPTSDEEVFDTSDLEELSVEDFPGYFEEFGNRLYHSSLTAPYPLPVDTLEQERFRVQHNTLKLLIGNNYVGAIPQLLAQDQTRQKVVVDIGTGRGEWAIEMAADFPHVQFHGLDIVPISQRTDLPDNVQFELHDINEPTRFHDRSIDLVHARSVSMTVRDFRTIIYEAARLLRPGGIFYSGEWGRFPSLHPDLDADLSTLVPNFVNFFNVVTPALATRRAIHQISHLIPTMIRDTGLFSEITTQEFCMPIGPWQGDHRLKRCGSAYRACLGRYMEAFRRLLAETGLNDDQMDQLFELAEQDMKEVPGLIGVFYTCYARKA